MQHLAKLAGVLLLAVVAQSCRADIYVVVNAENAMHNLSHQEVADLYLGRTRTYPNGTYARVLDQPNDKPVRAQFFRLLVGMPLSQVNAYWARLTFTGRQKPPSIENDDAAMLAAVGRSRQAIGFVASRPATPNVRIVLQMHD